MRNFFYSFLSLVSLLFITESLSAQAPDLGVANSFAVFTAVGAFSNIGNATIVTGDVGTNVGAFDAFPPGVLIGTVHVADPVSGQAAMDVAEAYAALDALTCNQVISTTMGNGQILTPDIYCTGAATTINGNLILDAQGDPDAIFIFQIDGALSTGTLANIVLINGASICNVWWQVNGAFTLGDGSVFRGNVLANGAIHLLEGSSLFGRALSQAGAIDLHNNIVSIGLPAVASVITADGPVTFCAGGSVTLSGNVDGEWSTGSTASSITVSASGDFYVVNTTLCGSDTSNHIIVTVVLETPPTIICPVNVTIECDESSLPANTGTATASDTCDPAPTVTFSDVVTAGTCPQESTVIRTWLATDLSGNTSTCVQTISVVDSTPPVITCPADIEIACTDSTLPANTGSATATDNCDPAVTVTFSDVISSPLCPMIIRTWIATDACGNSSTCNQVITGDNTVPVIITCPGNLNVQCDSDVPAVDITLVIASSTCPGVVVITLSGEIITNQTCANNYTLTRTYLATDACGNTATCAQTIIVLDTTSPVVACPANIAVQCAAQVPAPNINLTTSDNCGGTVTVAFAGDVISNQTCINSYTLIRTYLATDECGNSSTCAQTINVDDTTIPGIFCPPDVTLDCEATTLPAATGVATASDNCTGAVDVDFVDIILPGTCPQEYTISRTWIASDVCGNTISCVQTISVESAAGLTILCPVNVTVNCASAIPAVNIAGVTASANCGPVVVTFISDITVSPVCINQFTVNRTYQATDECGNTAVCVQVITVLDNVAPVITCPVNVTVNCASLVPSPAPASVTAISNCGETALITFVGDVITNQTCANRFTVTRTYRATDGCGNSSTCNQLITVSDNIPPSIVCPVNITVACASNVPLPNPSGIISTDNCGGTSTVSFVSDVISNQICINQYTLTRTYRAVDVCGNAVSCQQVITVFDNSPLTISCPANMALSCAGDIPPVNVALVVASSNCNDPITVTHIGDVTSSQTCANRFVLTRTYSATDGCGNSATCSQVFTVFDNTPPSITFDDQSFINGGTFQAQCFGQNPEWDLPVFDAGSVDATDNCAGSVTVTFLQTLLDQGECPTDGYINQYQLTWTATDACGNSSTAFFFMELVDTIPPVIFGVPVDITVNCNEIPELPLLVYATDECLCACVILLEETPLLPGCQDGQVMVRSWSATDRCGNVTIQTQTITIIDNDGPALFTIAGIADGAVMEFTCSEGGFPVMLDTMNEFSVLNPSSCGGAANITFDVETLVANNCEFFGYIEQRTYRWVATDLCGNTSDLTIIARLTDDEAPVLIGVPDMVCIGNPSLNEIEASDNCGNPAIRFWDVNIPNPCGDGTAIRRTYEAFDNCGNIATDTAILIPNAQIEPFIDFTDTTMLSFLTSGEPMILECASDGLNYSGYGVDDVLFTSACGQGVSVSFVENILSLGDCSTSGIVAQLELKWTATDLCGNTDELTLNATIIDESSPYFVNFEYDITIGCDDEMPEIFAADNCGAVTISTVDEIIPGLCSSQYTVSRLVTVTDACGNKNTVTQTVHVGNANGPVIDGVEEEVCDDLTIPVVTAYDACAEEFVGVTMTEDTIDVECRDGLVIERTWTATDICGNVSVIRQIIIMNDQTPPEIMVPTNSVIHFFLDNGQNSVLMSQVDIIKKLQALDEFSVFILDECDEEIEAVLSIDTIHGDCLEDGFVEQRVYTWIATDVCGNSASISFHVDIIDDMPPVFVSGSTDTTIVCEPLPAVPGVTIADLGEAVISFEETMVDGTSPGEFIVTRRWTATDSCGNTSVFIQIITWIPNTFLECELILPESFECNSHGVVISSVVTGGNGPIQYEWEIVGEKCFIQSGQGTPVINIYVGWSDVKVILTVTDSFGCVSMCMFILHCIESAALPLTLVPGTIDPADYPESYTPVPSAEVNEFDNLQLLTLWPNPANDKINVRFESLMEQQVEFILYNFMGKAVLTELITAQKGFNTHSLDVSKVYDGGYLLRLKSKHKILTSLIPIVR